MPETELQDGEELEGNEEAGGDEGDEGGEDDREVLLSGITFPDEEQDSEEEDDEEGEEKEEKGKPTVDDRLKDLETKYANASQHISDLKVALHQARQENKNLKSGKKGGEDFELTDQQVVAILKEHGNDWESVVKVINYQAAKAANHARTAAVDDVETKGIKSNLDEFLTKEWPEVLQEDSKIAPDIQNTIDKFRLEGNPFNRYLSAAALLMANWPKILANREAEIRKSILEGKAEGVRKKMVKGSRLADKGSERAADKLPPNIQARARQIGLNPRAAKIYARLVSGDSKKMTAIVEQD